DRQGRRHSPHLPTQPGRRGRPARPTRPVLEQSPGGLQADHRTINRGYFMTTKTQEASVRMQIVVAAPIEKAFRVFVEEFDRIKPREHNLLGVEIAETVFEPRVGGNIYDRGVDGSECRWARVLAFEPPHRIVITWDLNPQWQIETDPDKASEVEIRFISETPERTRLELEHRHLERHGAGWESTRDGVASPGGWPLYLQRYVDVLNR